jgi:F-type H+-transporting ATPase subunit a
MAAEHAPQSASEYIAHHLTNLRVGEGFWTFHLDTILMGWFTGIVGIGLFYLVARRATIGVPGRSRLRRARGRVRRRHREEHVPG